MFEFEVVSECALAREEDNGGVAFFVVCDKSLPKIGAKHAFDLEIAGEKIVNWVTRACDNAKVLEVFENKNGVGAVLPYLTTDEWTVVLNGNIPLVSKNHLKTIVDKLSLEGVNVCKLRGGVVAKTAYLREVGTGFFAEIRDIKTNDFLQVNSFENYLLAKYEIENRILNFYAKNDVFLEDDSCKVDAGAVLEKGCIVCSGSKILGQTTLAENCKIAKNCHIENCKIGKNVTVSDGAYLVGCTIGDGCKIGSNVVMKDTTLGENVEICDCCDIIMSTLANSSLVGALSRLYRAVIEEGYEVYAGKVIIHRLEDK